jgi:bla regulator protein blaR1
MSAELLRVFVASSLALSAAIVLVLALRGTLRIRFGARVAYALWALVPVMAMVALLPAPTVIATLPVSVADMPASVAAAPLVVAHATFDPLPWIAGAWLLGTFIALRGVLMQQRLFVRALGRLSVIDGDVMRAQSSRGCPALVGAIHPRIVLPVDFEQRYDAGERELILTHEHTHRARGDAQVNALAALLRCVFWFNPLVYFAASRFRFDQELACDAVVISRFPEARRRYAGAMLKTQLADFGLPVGCQWQSSHPLKERIIMLKQPLPSRARSALGAAIAIALVVGGTYAAWAAQPANVVTKSAAATIRGDIALRVDHGVEHRVSILTPAGVEFAVADGDENNRWELRGTVAPRADGTFELDGVIRHGVTIVSKPSLITGEGISASLSVDDAAAAHLDASFVLSRAEATTFSAPKSRPSENTSFREMHPPVYPQEAIEAHQTGHVVLRVHVDEKGNPQTAQVAEADPVEAGPAFSSASITAAMQWRYNPATVEGRAVAGDVAVPIDFNLIDD